MPILRPFDMRVCMGSYENVIPPSPIFSAIMLCQFNWESTFITVLSIIESLAARLWLRQKVLTLKPVI